MMAPIDLPRVRAALARLDALLRAFPELRGPKAGERLRRALTKPTTTPAEPPARVRSGLPLLR